MDKISLNEALTAMLVEQDHVDASNAIQRLRTAQQRVVTSLRVAPSGAGNFMHKQRPIDEADALIILAARNGLNPLFD